MTRKEITEFLGKLVIDRIGHRGSYWAKEVSIDYGSSDVKRVDFLQFEPAGVMSISEIEKGIFTCYEVKSCKEDVFSGHRMETISHHKMPAGSQKAIYDRVVILYAEKWAVEENKESGG